MYKLVNYGNTLCVFEIAGVQIRCASFIADRRIVHLYPAATAEAVFRFLMRREKKRRDRRFFPFDRYRVNNARSHAPKFKSIRGYNCLPCTDTVALRS